MEISIESDSTPTDNQNETKRIEHCETIVNEIMKEMLDLDALFGCFRRELAPKDELKVECD